MVAYICARYLNGHSPRWRTPTSGVRRRRLEGALGWVVLMAAPTCIISWHILQPELLLMLQVFPGGPDQSLIQGKTGWPAPPPALCLQSGICRSVGPILGGRGWDVKKKKREKL
jgi:hypothetical protein